MTATQRRLATCAATLAAVLLGAAADARAAQYHAFVCRVPYGPSAGQPAPTEGIALPPVNGPFLSSGNECAGGGNLHAEMDGGTEHPYGHFALITYDPPAGTTISGFTVWRSERVTAVQPFGAPVTNILYRPGPATAESLCAQSFGCSERGTPSVPLSDNNDLAAGPLTGVTQIEASAGCGGGPGGVCPKSGDGSPSALYRIHAMDILLDDPTPPASAGPASGPLLSGAVQAGTQPIAVRATDGQSGVARVVATLDGVPASDQVVGGCTNLGVTGDGRPSYTLSRPCAATVDAQVGVNTAVVPSGTHQLVVHAVDAAGNTALLHSGPIRTRQVLRTGPNGSPPSANAKLLVRFGARPGRRSRFVSQRSTARVNGLLRVKGSRQPIAGAVVQVYVREVRRGAPRQEIATVLTGPDGRFAYGIPPGPSRRVTFAYRSLGEGRVDSSSTLGLDVRARIRLLKAPRSVRGGRRATVVGVVSPARAGVRVVAQFRKGRGWSSFGSLAETRRNGRFVLRVPFERGRTRAGRLRIKLQSETYPYWRGSASRPFRIVVRGG